MEIKAAGAMPIWLVTLLNEGKILPVSFSKYGRAYQIMLTEGSIEFVRSLAENRRREAAADKQFVPGAALSRKKEAAYA